MPGDADTDPLYVLARRALLDGLEALEPHLGSVVVVGAQAVYLHTGPADLPVAEFTTDADLAIAPEFLADEPSIQTLLEERGFELQEDPGTTMPTGPTTSRSSGLLLPRSLDTCGSGCTRITIKP